MNSSPRASHSESDGEISATNRWGLSVCRNLFLTLSRLSRVVSKELRIDVHHAWRWVTCSFNTECVLICARGLWLLQPCCVQILFNSWKGCSQFFSRSFEIARLREISLDFSLALFNNWIASLEQVCFHRNKYNFTWRMHSTSALATFYYFQLHRYSFHLQIIITSVLSRFTDFVTFKFLSANA